MELQAKETGRGSGCTGGQAWKSGAGMRDREGRAWGESSGWLTCRVVDRGPRRVERILGRRSTRRVHEARLGGYRAGFGVLGVRVHWLHWDACHWNLLAWVGDKEPHLERHLHGKQGRPSQLCSETLLSRASGLPAGSPEGQLRSALCSPQLGFGDLEGWGHSLGKVLSGQGDGSWGLESCSLASLPPGGLWHGPLPSRFRHRRSHTPFAHPAHPRAHTPAPAHTLPESPTSLCTHSLPPDNTGTHGYSVHTCPCTFLCMGDKLAGGESRTHATESRLLELQCPPGGSAGLSGAHLPSPAPTFKRALQLLAPAVQVAAGAEEAADGGGDHSHEEDHGRSDACYGLGALDREACLTFQASSRKSSQGDLKAVLGLLASRGPQRAEIWGSWWALRNPAGDLREPRFPEGQAPAGQRVASGDLQWAPYGSNLTG